MILPPLTVRDVDATERMDAPDCDPLRLDRADGVAVVEHNVFVSDTERPKATTWHPEGSRVTWRDNLFVNFTDQPQ